MCGLGWVSVLVFLRLLERNAFEDYVEKNF